LRQALLPHDPQPPPARAPERRLCQRAEKRLKSLARRLLENRTRPHSGGVAKRPGKGSAFRRRSSSRSLKDEPRSAKKATPITPTLRSSPVREAYESRTEPKRKAATSSMLRRKPSISTVAQGPSR